jgi:putative inorganic carbon (HCO3(-)) transporter
MAGCRFPYEFGFAAGCASFSFSVMGLTRTSSLKRLIEIADRYQWLFLGLAAPFLLFPSPGRSLALLVIPFIFLIGWLARREAIPRTPFNGSLLLMAVMVLVSIWVTPDMSISYEAIARILLGFATLFCVARYTANPGILRWVLLFYLSIGPAIATLGLLGTRWVSNKFDLLARISALFPARWTAMARDVEGFNPNALAGGLILVLPVLICCSIAFLRQIFTNSLGVGSQKGLHSSRWMVIGLFLGTLFVLGVFVLSQSRGAYLAFVLASSAMLWLVSSRHVRIALTVLALLGIVLLGLFVQQNGLGAIVATPTEATADADNVVTLDSLDTRIELWSRAIDAIQDFPITGIGMNMFRQVVPNMYPLFLISPDTDIVHAHNEFLQVALDLGIPGLIAFIALYIGAFGLLARISDLNQDGLEVSFFLNTFLPLKALLLGLGGGLGAYLLFSMVDVHVMTGKRGVIFWILLGIIAGLHTRYDGTSNIGLTVSAPSRVSGGTGEQSQRE